MTYGDQLRGLYLSSYIDWHRLLCLRPDGEYRLLFWRIHHQTFERIEVRYYSGGYAVSKTDDGDDIVTLDIVLRQDSLGSDANDQELIMIRSGDTALLLRTEDMEEAASAMVRHKRLGRSDHYFFRTTLRSPLADEPSDGREALPEGNLPAKMRALIVR
ncbi:hypothetical protein ACSBM8_09485 [Sphingomonas sp. ASY06-1R]|uniref:hypothetical protein n=1 Tax=Sphingomonas sp. ASY06-1R TaxID=3445771 RepID=UPI003FA1D94F